MSVPGLSVVEVGQELPSRNSLKKGGMQCSDDAAGRRVSALGMRACAVSCLLSG